MSITFEQVKNNEEIKTYIRKADESLKVIGYTEHSFAHVVKTAQQAADILDKLGYPARTVELARIAGYMHDIGNVINRKDHAQSGAVMSFRILDKMGMPADELATVICAIGNHDEGTAAPVNEVAAALILADKSDVRRSRVRQDEQPPKGDIHDRVNYSVDNARLEMDVPGRQITLRLTIDTGFCAVMDYFEIFLGRMLLCRRAAEYLGLQFRLVINEAAML
ncbi:MAG: HD domain-containing protein [Clostridia bacterium]|nr:HD domain-containing protein [Clostridia bacterium]